MLCHLVVSLTCRVSYAALADGITSNKANSTGISGAKAPFVKENYLE